MRLRTNVARIILAGIIGFYSVFPAVAQSDLPAAKVPPRSDVSATTQVAVPSADSYRTASGGTVMGPGLEDYRLGSGDKLSMTVYGEDDLKAEFIVDGSGQVQIPLVGLMHAAGLSVKEFTAEVGKNLQEFLKAPRVSIQVLNYRPFYIIGEVNKPGEFPYEAGLNILGAVALAGGFTYRARDTEVYVRHMGTTKEEKMPAESSTRIAPGDVVRVAERIF